MQPQVGQSLIGPTGLAETRRGDTRRIREWQKQVCLQRELTLLLLLLQLHLLLLLLLFRPHKPQAALIRQA